MHTQIKKLRIGFMTRLSAICSIFRAASVRYGSSTATVSVCPTVKGLMQKAECFLLWTARCLL